LSPSVSMLRAAGSKTTVPGVLRFNAPSAPVDPLLKVWAHAAPATSSSNKNLFIEVLLGPKKWRPGRWRYSEPAEHDRKSHSMVRHRLWLAHAPESDPRSQAPAGKRTSPKHL